MKTEIEKLKALKTTVKSEKMAAEIQKKINALESNKEIMK